MEKVTLFFLFFSIQISSTRHCALIRRYSSLILRQPRTVLTSKQVGVGKGCEVHLADLNWLKKQNSSPLCLFSAFHMEQSKQSWIYCLFTEGQSESGAKKKKKIRMEEAKRVSPQRLQPVMRFRLKLDQTIREETADLVNSGPPWTHLRWKLIRLCVSERKCFLLLSLAAAVWIPSNSCLIV